MEISVKLPISDERVLLHELNRYLIADIALAIIPAVKSIGTKLNTTFSSISTQLK